MQHDFKTRVYDVVSAIAPGTVMTYKEVATAVGAPRSARAVARVLSKNYDERIPCHRVIRSDGSVGGYNRGGEAAKQQLLWREGYQG